MHRLLSSSHVASRGPLHRRLSQKCLTVDNINSKVREMEYAVRGLLPIQAEKLNQQLKSNQVSKDFEEVLFCNIGNPQAVGQPPITYYREVLALTDAPSLRMLPNADSIFPTDVVARATTLAQQAGSTGAYTGIKGVEGFRRDVAEFLEARDGHSADLDKIYLINGASAGIATIMQTIIASPDDAVMIPIPQYPIYSALITLRNGHGVGYYLDEDNGWALCVDDLQKQFDAAKSKGQNPRALVVINPGNPTGNVLSYDNLVDIVKFCHKNRLVILADEVYQANVYTEEKRFHSMKQVIKDLGEPYADMELASFHSTSKGIIGECGRRGGFMELNGFDPDVEAQIFKLASSGLCSNVDGQVMTSLMTKAPEEQGPSYGQWKEECDAIYQGLRRKAKKLEAALNDVEGVSCQPLEGAMYAFPRIDLPQEAVQAAQEKGLAPDTYYALSLLDYTGICAVPGSGFGQKEGTYHLRLTFLPDEDKLMRAIAKFKEHHKWFIAKHK